MPIAIGSINICMDLAILITINYFNLHIVHHIRKKLSMIVSVNIPQRRKLFS